MKNYTALIFIAYLLPAALFAEVPMRPGSILAIAGFAPPHTLVEIAPDGTILGEVTVIDPEGLVQAPSGLTVLNGAIWISGTSRVLRVDPATGALSDAFFVDAPLTALADDGENLWVGAIHPDRLLRYSSNGTLLDTIFLAGTRLLTGLDIETHGDSAMGEWSFLISSYATGHVHTFDSAGDEVAVIETDLFPGNLTGVSLEPGGGALWLTLGTGTNEIVHADLDGNILGEIPGSGLVVGLRGLEVLDATVFADDFESGTLENWAFPR